jgi:hypothetical protein
MKVFKEIITNTQKLADILCDKCDKSTFKTMNHEYATLYANWGYDSNQDGACYDLHLCEDCFNTMIVSFIRNKPIQYG